MARILLVSAKEDNLSDLANGLSTAEDVNLHRAESGASALRSAARLSPRLVVIDEEIGDMAPLDLVVGLLELDATIATAVLSKMPPEEFHEASEGLGVMAQLPPQAGREHVARLLQKLKVVQV